MNGERLPEFLAIGAPRAEVAKLLSDHMRLTADEEPAYPHVKRLRRADSLEAAIEVADGYGNTSLVSVDTPHEKILRDIIDEVDGIIQRETPWRIEIAFNDGGNAITLREAIAR